MQVSESTLKDLIEGEQQFQGPFTSSYYSQGEPDLGQLWDDTRDFFRHEDARRRFLEACRGTEGAPGRRERRPERMSSGHLKWRGVH